MPNRGRRSARPHVRPLRARSSAHSLAHPSAHSGAHPLVIRVAAVLALAPVTALAACGQPTPSRPDVSLAPTVSVPVQPTILPVTPTDDTIDPSAPGDAGLFDASSSLTAARCEPGAGDVWSFTGTLTNPDDERHTFTVAAFIVKTSDGSDVASREVEVTLEAGASAPVRIDKLWTGEKRGVECLSGVTVKGQ